MKALIVDPALHSMGGHHYSATLALQAELSALAIDHACLASSSADMQVTKDLGGVPCFTTSVYGRTYRDAQEFRDKTRQTYREFSRALRRQGPWPDLLILPCCDQVLALAVARRFRRSWFRRPPHVILWILFGPHPKKPTDHPSLGPLQAECRQAFAALSHAVGDGRLEAYCETEGMAEVWRALSGLDIGVAAGPGAIAAEHARGPGHRTGPPTVACLGFANESKGYRLLPGAVERLLAQHGDVRFAIHGVFGGSDAADQAPVFARLAALGSRVVVRTDVLSPADYLAWLHTADLLLLPYDPEVYRTRGSGVFTDARCLGIPVVATSGCAFARPAFDQGWGVPIADRDEAGVARAVLQALGRLDDLTAHARSQRTAAAAGRDATAILRAAVAAIR